MACSPSTETLTQRFFPLISGPQIQATGVMAIIPAHIMRSVGGTLDEIKAVGWMLLMFLLVVCIVFFSYFLVLFVGCLYCFFSYFLVLFVGCLYCFFSYFLVLFVGGGGGGGGGGCRPKWVRLMKKKCRIDIMLCLVGCDLRWLDGNVIWLVISCIFCRWMLGIVLYFGSNYSDWIHLSHAFIWLDMSWQCLFHRLS